jgi:ribose-phosphate pyrophosphokinase
VDSDAPILFSGSSHPALAGAIADYVGVELGDLTLESFPDGELFAQVQENVRDRDVFVIQSVAGRPNHYLMELLLVIDALRRASAGSVTAVLPYYGYARQDRKDRGRVPITAKLVANLVTVAGADRLLTMDLHADQVQGFFDIPVDNLYGRPTLVPAIRGLELENLMVVAPDVGSIKIARSFAGDLGVDFAIVNKERLSSEKVAVTTVIGDVSGHAVLLTDDMCSTAGTLVAAAEACLAEGATRVLAAVTHGLLVGGGLERIEASPIERLFVTDTIAQGGDASKVQVCSVSRSFGEAIRRVVRGESLSSMFEKE